MKALLFVAGLFLMNGVVHSVAAPYPEKEGEIFDVGSIDVKPKLIKPVQPVYPENPFDTAIEGEVVVEFVIDKAGQVVKADVVETNHALFERPALNAIFQWKFSPGLKGGRPVAVKVSTLQTISFRSGTGSCSLARLRDWQQPEYPAAARQAKIEGEVEVEFVVEADGKVSRAEVKKSSDERFNASALAAVHRWGFVPATSDRKPIASGMRVAVTFKLAQLQQKKAPVEPPRGLLLDHLRMTKAKVMSSPLPDYPAELAARKLSGKVVLEFTVEADGMTSAPKVLWTSDAACVGEALLALEKYRFEPAHQGSLLLKSAVTERDVEFESPNVSVAEVLATNQISVVEPDRYARLPRPIVFPEPVYPWEQLLAGETGSATVEFTVTERGVTSDVLLREASRPEFGAALIAAAEAWQFEAGLLKNKKFAAAKLVAVYKFSPSTAGAVNRLTLALQPGGVGVSSAVGLAEPLRPIWRVQPIYPNALLNEKPTGQAVIEFVVDQNGRARLPRVVSASRGEFGWAAATAISQWVFARPTRGGQPVEVKVSIPINFSAPKE